MIWVLIIFWFILNIILALFIGHEFFLMGFALKKKKSDKNTKDQLKDFPKVCVQLPIYNEKFVIERLIDSVLKINYPKEKLVIQVLDDSTDETTEIVSNKILNENLHLQVQHVRRTNRDGFKAGALKYGMTLTDAEYFLIFDADFIPDENFLNETMPHFADEKIGVVQTRWSHLNEDYSLLTRAESVMLDAHFGIEQQGRSNAGGFINFNGTAGIWRRTCIEDAGGWQGDTLTEDLDLSFRAQIKHWKINYLFHFKSPAELPVTFNAYRNQQYRWSKGAAECFRKNRSLLWKSDTSFTEKLIGTIHLLNSSVYMLVLCLMLLAPCVEYALRNYSSEFGSLIWVPYLGLINNGLLMIILLTGKLKCSKNKVKTVLWFLPSVLMFFVISLAIAPYMAIAVISGYLGIKTEFIRTPKFGNNPLKNMVQLNYKQRSSINLTILEIILLFTGLFWFIFGIFDFNAFTLVYGFLLSVAFFIAVFRKHSELRFLA